MKSFVLDRRCDRVILKVCCDGLLSGRWSPVESEILLLDGKLALRLECLDWLSKDWLKWFGLICV